MAHIYETHYQEFERTFVVSAYARRREILQWIPQFTNNRSKQYIQCLQNDRWQGNISGNISYYGGLDTAVKSCLCTDRTKVNVNVLFIAQERCNVLQPVHINVNLKLSPQDGIELSRGNWRHFTWKELALHRWENVKVGCGFMSIDNESVNGYIDYMNDRNTFGCPKIQSRKTKYKIDWRNTNWWKI